MSWSDGSIRWTHVQHSGKNQHSWTTWSPEWEQLSNQVNYGFFPHPQKISGLQYLIQHRSGLFVLISIIIKNYPRACYKENAIWKPVGHIKLYARAIMRKESNILLHMMTYNEFYIVIWKLLNQITFFNLLKVTLILFSVQRWIWDGR